MGGSRHVTRRPRSRTMSVSCSTEWGLFPPMKSFVLFDGSFHTSFPIQYLKCHILPSSRCVVYFVCVQSDINLFRRPYLINLLLPLFSTFPPRLSTSSPMATSTIKSRDIALAATAIRSNPTGSNPILDHVAGNLENMCQQLRLMVERLRAEHQQADDLQEEKRALEEHISGLQSRVSEVRDNSSHAQAEVKQLRDENNTLTEQLEDAWNTIKVLHQKKDAAEDYVDRLAGLLESRPTKRKLQIYSADSDRFLKRTRELTESSGSSSGKVDSSTGTDDDNYDSEYTYQSTPLLRDGTSTGTGTEIDTPLRDSMPPSSEFGIGHSTDRELRIHGHSSGQDSDHTTSSVVAATSNWRKNSPLERRLVCHRCFGQGLSCDNNTVCGHCDAAHTECTRSLCTDFGRKGGCYWKRCLRVHDEQGYNVINVPLERSQHGRGRRSGGSGGGGGGGSGGGAGSGGAPPASHWSK